MYYCKHCGQPYQTEEAVMCVKCGAPKGKGTNFCHNCGKAIDQNASVCMNCGVATSSVKPADAKSKIVAGLLGIFLGCFGVHNFYLGYTQKAVIQLVLTLVGLVLCCVGIGAFIVLGVEIWGLVEGIMILAGSINKDGKGNSLAN
ncbi:MAG: TM2 domain-containing protein [Lachnospiraceae bacterium]|nr:TM2 domain-containing protein [Lachnospiraceae bacterium]